jgi:hypothetical protein
VSQDRETDYTARHEQKIATFTVGGRRVGTDVPSKIGPNWTRRAVVAIAGLESMAMLVIVVTLVGSGQLSSGEALSRSLGGALLAIYGLPYLGLAVPALLLAALNRHLPIALALSLLVIPTVWLFVRYA